MQSYFAPASPLIRFDNQARTTSEYAGTNRCNDFISALLPTLASRRAWFAFGRTLQRVVGWPPARSADSQAARFFSATMLLSSSPNSASAGTRIRRRAAAGSSRPTVG